jgi:hypothetical protein
MRDDGRGACVLYAGALVRVKAGKAYAFEICRSSGEPFWRVKKLKL